MDLWFYADVLQFVEVGISHILLDCPISNIALVYYTLLVY